MGEDAERERRGRASRPGAAGQAVTVARLMDGLHFSFMYEPSTHLGLALGGPPAKISTRRVKFSRGNSRERDK